jgi:hypothetical protein
LETTVSATRVEVGQRFSVQITCNLDAGSESPTNPKLPAPREISISGPSISTNQSIAFVNGQVTRKSGVTATWVLIATTTGRFRIGPPSIEVDGQRLVDRPIDITVVAAGSNPQGARQRRRPSPFDPFDPFGGSDPFSGPMFPPMPGLKLDLGQAEETVPAIPSELNVDQAKDPLAFVDARALPKRVVVGEQVRLNVYIYNKPGVDPTNLAEPNLDGFLSYRSEHDDLLTRVYAIQIGEERYHARKVLSYALFPTKTGALTIGPTVVSFGTRSRLLGGGQGGFDRNSNPVTILVVEPPLKGRPPFYHIGDVGQFKLNATVEPRQIKVGEAVSVQVEVSGTGQLPQRLDPPEQAGVDWLEPSVSQQVEEQRDKIGGQRQLSYVVHLNREGTIDLGELRFAYFDPTTRKYVTLKQPLGTVAVAANPAGTPGATTASLGAPIGANPNTSSGPALLPRGKLSPTEALPRPWSERRGFFFWLGFGPVTTLLFFGLKWAVRRANDLRRKQATSAKAVVQAELEAAKRALATADYANAASAVERAVHLAIEHRVGLRSRAILRNELGPKLVATGLEESVAQGLIELLERCDHQRFVQTDAQASAQLVADATARIKLTLATTAKNPGVGS